MVHYITLEGCKSKFYLWVKRELVNLCTRGGTGGISEGWQGSSKGFLEGEAQGKSWGAALPDWGKPRRSRFCYSDLHSVCNRSLKRKEKNKACWAWTFQKYNLAHFWCQISNSDKKKFFFNKTIARNIFVNNCVVVGTSLSGSLPSYPSMPRNFDF